MYVREEGGGAALRSARKGEYRGEIRCEKQGSDVILPKRVWVFSQLCFSTLIWIFRWMPVKPTYLNEVFLECHSSHSPDAFFF